MIKSLLSRNHKLGVDYWIKMISLIEELPIGMSQLLSENFAVFFEDVSEMISKPLYKQKYFVLGFPILLEKYYKTQERKFIYLIAVGQLLTGLPKEVLLQVFPNILPLIIESLKLRPMNNNTNTENNLLQSTIQILSPIIKEVPDQITDHLSIVIPSLLQLATLNYSSLKLRQLSLQCLYQLSSLPYVSLFKYKSQVLFELTGALDDKKKIVRREAVRTRNKWFSLTYK